MSDKKLTESITVKVVRILSDIAYADCPMVRNIPIYKFPDDLRAGDVVEIYISEDYDGIYGVLI